MGFFAKPVPKKNGTIGFKILQDVTENGQRVQRAIRKQDWLTHGINPAWSLEEARAWAKAQNASKELKRYAERKLKTQSRLHEEHLARLAYLPPELRQFEAEKLARRWERNPKLRHTWTFVTKMLAHLRLNPPDYGDQKERFYDYFASKRCSIAYVHKLLRDLNAWGAYYCKRRKLFFEKVPAPTHTDRKTIVKANRAKVKKQGNRVSEPLTFEMLEAKKGELRPEHYNWLYVRIAFGLRPSDRPGKVWQQDGIPVLDVFQPKLDHDGDEENAWKSIPCVLPEQKVALKLLAARKLEAPSNKIISSRWPGCTQYCGRNNFIPMMFEHGRTIEEVSAWMGHKTVERTWSYWIKLKNRKLVTKAA